MHLQHFLLSTCRRLLPQRESGQLALLAALAGMAEMQDLQLWVDGWFAGAAMPAYSGLTASSQLSMLVVGYGSDAEQGLIVGGDSLPSTGCSHMFAADRQLPSLQVLRMKMFEMRATQSMPAVEAQARDMSAVAAAEGATAGLPASAAAEAEVSAPAQQVIDSISGCCPGLLDLRLYMTSYGTGNSTLQLGGLQACTHLTALCLLGAWPVHGEAWGLLAQLIALQDLRVHCTGTVHHAELRLLTNLRQLQQLEVEALGRADSGNAGTEEALLEDGVFLSNKVCGLGVPAAQCSTWCSNTQHFSRPVAAVGYLVCTGRLVIITPALRHHCRICGVHSACMLTSQCVMFALPQEHCTEVCTPIA